MTYVTRLALRAPLKAQLHEELLLFLECSSLFVVAVIVVFLLLFLSLFLCCFFVVVVSLLLLLFWCCCLLCFVAVAADIVVVVAAADVLTKPSAFDWMLKTSYLFLSLYSYPLIFSPVTISTSRMLPCLVLRPKTANSATKAHCGQKQQRHQQFSSVLFRPS